ncbi:TetR family transcriptional regulator [Acinetobacter larvae]|uniref:TetR family transcriptional regulator n=1 Tax=Acinetobacter larvae TaxID=1789224 RepID=A0A1B2M0Q8_9GAMM|nr:TetR family transcriptional regulator [Acinetobacter larvae]AOA58770.1 TetR family transcriptional regulator [Acinetobacter larvae]
MSYLQRDKRRELILAAAMQIALQDGLAAITARRVAQQAEVSTGQVHHHFQSISHLRAESFLALMQQMEAIEADFRPQTPLARLLVELGAENIEQTQAYLALWNEAEVLLNSDAVLKEAYKLNMQLWQQNIVAIIEQGILAHAFQLRSNQNSQQVAWQFIAFVCGLEGIYQLGLTQASAEDFKQHMSNIITALLSPSNI